MSGNFFPKFRVAFVATTLLLILTPWHAADAQAVFGQIIGTVSAPNGAPVPNATVTVTNVAKGTTTTYTTNSDGQFELGSQETLGADTILYLVAKGGTAARKSEASSAAIPAATRRLVRIYACLRR